MYQPSAQPIEATEKRADATAESGVYTLGCRRMELDVGATDADRRSTGYSASAILQGPGVRSSKR